MILPRRLHGILDILLSGSPNWFNLITAIHRLWRRVNRVPQGGEINPVCLLSHSSVVVSVWKTLGNNVPIVSWVFLSAANSFWRNYRISANNYLSRHHCLRNYRTFCWIIRRFRLVFDENCRNSCEFLPIFDLSSTTISKYKVISSDDRCRSPLMRNWSPFSLIWPYLSTLSPYFSLIQ